MLSARRSLTGRVTGEEDLHTGKGKNEKEILTDNSVDRGVYAAFRGGYRGKA